MEFLGGYHLDTNDGEGGMTFMVPLSDLPEDAGWEPGWFHLLALGVFIVLDPLTLIYFTGRQMHEGTAPLAPSNTIPQKWACRLVVVAYPSGRIQRGNVKHAWAASHFPIFLYPETTGAMESVPLVRTEESCPFYSNIAMDGVMTMPVKSHFDFTVRGGLQLVMDALAQLPQSYNVHVVSMLIQPSFSTLFP